MCCGKRTLFMRGGFVGRCDQLPPMNGNDTGYFQSLTPCLLSTASTRVNLALQLEDGERRTQSFVLSTTLWDVLLGFERESNG